MANKQYSVYYLVDPTTLRPRYVGYSFRPDKRFTKSHLVDKTESYKARWIRKLLREGLRPILVIKCLLQTQEEAFRVEIALIARLKEQGEQLTNATSGGEGAPDISTETREKKSAKMRERYENPIEREASRLITTLAWMNPELRTQRMIALAKSWDNQERREHASDVTKKRWEDPKFREDQSALRKDKPWSEIRREAATGVYVKTENWRPGALGYKHTQATKNAIAAKQLGGTLPEWTPERRAKIDAAWEAKRVAKQAEKNAQDILFGPKPIKQPKTHCPRGHEYNEQNRKTYIRPNGNVRVECVECRREKDRDKYASRTLEEIQLDAEKRELYLTPEKKTENARKRKERDELRFEADQKAFALL